MAKFIQGDALPPPPKDGGFRARVFMKATDALLAFNSVCEKMEASDLPQDRIRLMEDYKVKIRRMIATGVYGVVREEEIDFLIKDMDIAAELGDIPNPPLDLVLTIADFVKLWNAVSS